MAKGQGNPELEDGFSRIANETLEALAHTPLSDYESRCLHFLWRRTYGWQDGTGQAKKFDVISQTQWSQGTSISRRRINSVLARLVNRNIITKHVTFNKSRRIILWGFQKRYKEWLSPKQATSKHEVAPNEATVTLSPKQATSKHEMSPNEATLRIQMSPIWGQVSPKQATKVSPKQAHTKDIKTLYTKDNIEAQGPKKAPDPLNELREKVFEVLKGRRGYNSPNPGAEAKAITWMLKQGYSVEIILAAHSKMSQDPFWSDKFLSMVSVKSQIGAITQAKKKGWMPQLPTTEQLEQAWGEKGAIIGGEDAANQ